MCGENKDNFWVEKALTREGHYAGNTVPNFVSYLGDNPSLMMAILV
jgi:hypothetical protein